MLREHEVCILLAAYDGRKYIREMIESILSQDCDNWILILSDDGDKTADILEEYAQAYPECIIHYQSGMRFGSAKAHFLHLLEHFHDADYIMFADQDDVWKHDKVSATLQKMHDIEIDRKVPSLVHTDLHVVSAEGASIDSSFAHYEMIDCNNVSFNQMILQNVVTGCTMLFNKSLAELVCRVPVMCKDIVIHDWWIALIASAFGRIEFLNCPTIDYRQHGNNSVGAVNIRNLRYVLKKTFVNRDYKEGYWNSIRQTAFFFDSYGDLLTEDKIQVVKAFLATENKGKLIRWHMYSRYKLWKKSIIGGIVQFIWW